MPFLPSQAEENGAATFSESSAGGPIRAPFKAGGSCHARIDGGNDHPRPSAQLGGCLHHHLGAGLLGGQPRRAFTPSLSAPPSALALKKADATPFTPGIAHNDPAIARSGTLRA